MEAGEKNPLYLNDAAIINHALGKRDLARTSLFDRRRRVPNQHCPIRPLFDDIRSDPEFESIFASIRKLRRGAGNQA